MFDDLFSATALVTLGGVLAAGVWAGASELAAPSQVLAAKPVPAAVAPAQRVAAQAALPVYQLPRVVIDGHRSRDGDQLAAELPPPAGR